MERYEPAAKPGYTRIFHITHYRNLRSIVQSGSLWSDTRIAQSRVGAQSIALAKLKERRAMWPVKVCKGGVVADYVPFYFAPRSPMLYVNWKRQLEHYQEGQEPIVHLVCSAESIAEAGLPFLFTSGHAIVALSKQLTDLGQLSELDWTVLRGKWWNDTDDDGDRCRRRQAEFLVHDQLPWRFVRGIGVIDEEMRDRVAAIVGSSTPIAIKRDWYYP